MAVGAALLLCGLVAVATAAPSTTETEVELRMPNVKPTVPDTYFCHTMKAPKEATYLTGFIPHGNMSTAHHILLYGCGKPGSDKDVWNCGEMKASTPGFDMGEVCGEGSQIIYAWAMDAPRLNLPEGVGFKIGADTDIQYLVLQVHYKDVSLFVPPNHQLDDSGLTLMATTTPQPKRAGVYLLGTGGTIPAHSTTYMETACSMDDNIVAHPFAYRTHAHTHGKVVAGYVVKDGEWEEIGRMSPQKPQMFYNVTHPGITIKPGDVMAARCTMVNDEDRAISIGATQKDEMCNFYIMYYVEGPQIMSQEYCFSAGPPHWYWSNMRSISTNNIPTDASQVPGEDKIYKATEQFVSKMEDMANNVEKEFHSWVDQLGDGQEANFIEDEEYPDRAVNPAYQDLLAQEELRRALRNYPSDINDIDPADLEEFYREVYDVQ